MKRPRRLDFTPYEKVWGSLKTAPWYANSDDRRIGEVWFKTSQEFPLLVKLLFTSEALSVQVHPNDEFARRHENCAGKTEMWHVLRAEPEAKVALGLREEIGPERLREASLSGEIEQLLNWIPAHAGDTFLVRAGTIHAIGAGLILCEVQQFSDVTYRLYDYGRPRELHLDRSIQVANAGPCEAYRKPIRLADGRELLAECEYFRTERVALSGTALCPESDRNTLYVVLEGEGTIAGEPFKIGEAWEAPVASEPFEIASPGATILITSQP